MFPGKLVPGKMVSGKMGPKNWSSRNSGTKNRGVSVEHRGVCVWNVGIWSIYENPKLDNKPKTWKQTQNSETKIRGVSVEHRGVCVECSDVINLWNPETRQQTFLDSFRVLQFGEYVGSWGKRRTSFCVSWNQSIKIKKSFKFPSILLTANNVCRTVFRGPIFRGPFFRRPFFRGPFFRGPFFRVPVNVAYVVNDNRLGCFVLEKQIPKITAEFHEVTPVQPV